MEHNSNNKNQVENQQGDKEEMETGEGGGENTELRFLRGTVRSPLF